jgi:hypothetical protein
VRVACPCAPSGPDSGNTTVAMCVLPGRRRDLDVPGGDDAGSEDTNQIQRVVIDRQLLK